MSRKRQELYEKLNWSRAATEEHPGGGVVRASSPPAVAWPAPSPWQVPRSRSASPTDGTQRPRSQQAPLTSNFDQPRVSAAGLHAATNGTAGAAWLRPQHGRRGSPSGRPPTAERPSTVSAPYSTRSRAAAARPFTAPIAEGFSPGDVQHGRYRDAGGQRGGPGSKGATEHTSLPHVLGASGAAAAAAMGPRSNSAGESAGMADDAWRPELTLPLDPASITREELAMTYGQAWERWERTGHTNTVSRTFRLGAPLTSAEMMGSKAGKAGQANGDATGDVLGDGTGATEDDSATTSAAMFAAKISGTYNGGLDGGRALFGGRPAIPAFGKLSIAATEGTNGDSPRMSRVRTMQMSARQKLGEVKDAADRQIDYIRMQREYVEERLGKLRAAPGYRLMSSSRSMLPDLATALAALTRSEAEPEDDEPPHGDSAPSRSGAGVHASLRLQVDGDPSGCHDTAVPATGRRAQHKQATGQVASHASGHVQAAISPFAGALRSPVPTVPGSMFGGPRALNPSTSKASTGLSADRSSGTLGRGLGTTTSLRKSIVRSASVARSGEDMPEVDTTHLFIPDVSIRPDTENEEDLDTVLRQLKDAADAPGTDDKGTYSHLVKPALNSAASPFAVPGAEHWDSTVTLNWACRGIGEKKMGVLRDTMLQNTFLTGLQLGGNNLTDKCVSEILSVLSLPEAPPMKQIDLSSNTALGWRCAYPIAAALGANLSLHAASAATADPDAGPAGTGASSGAGNGGSAAGAAADGVGVGGLPPSLLKAPISRLGLRRLVLQGVKIQDKGALVIASALKDNKVLKELNLSRCSITDPGGEAIVKALSAGFLESLDLSWNSLRGDSARALRDTLNVNGSLQDLNLSYNGFSDGDAALVLMGLSNHGHWRRIDLSYNNLGAGSALVLSELLDLLGKKAAELVSIGAYGESWDLARFPPGKVDTRGWIPVGEAAKQPDVPNRHTHHEELGKQLQRGPVLLDVGGNPLGFAGLRQVLHSLDWMSTVIEDAAVTAATRKGAGAAAGGEMELLLPAWPLHLLISNCNVDLTDTPPEGSQMEGMDSHSPNPFLPSLMQIMEGAQAAAPKKAGAKKKGDGGDKKGGKKGSGKAADPVKPGKEYFLTTQSQSLDLTSPAGKYKLELSHPGSWLVMRHLLDLMKQLEAANAEGLLQNVLISLKEVTVNDKPSKAERLAALQEVVQGVATFTVSSPALLMASEPSAISDQVVEWMLVTLSDKSCSELWKLSCIQVACSHFYFTWEQALQLIDLFDAEMATSERLRAGEMLYARCTNPLDFWLCAMPTLPLLQVEMMIQRLGELAAFDIHNCSGRFMLNLSRSLDRFMAMRLQEASALENSCAKEKYYVNWRNAMLNGSPLTREGLFKIRNYTIPDTGTLRLDYVTYKVPDPATEPCDPEDVRQLLSQLRAIIKQYEESMLLLREEYLPYGKLRSEQKQPQPIGRSTTVPAARAQLEEEDPSRAWGASKTMGRTLPELVDDLLLDASASTAAAAPAPAPDPSAASPAAAGAPAGDPGNGAGASAGGMPPGEGGAAAAAGTVEGAGAPPGTAQKDADVDVPPPTRAWWLEAGFTAGKSLLQKYLDISKLREELRRAAALAKAEAEAATFVRIPGGQSPERSRPGTSTGARPSTAPKDGKASGGAKQKDGAGKGGKGGKGGKAAAKAKTATPPPFPPPQNRTAGAHLSLKEEEQAEELAFQLLRVVRLKDAAVVLSKFSARHVARVLRIFLKADPVGGARAGGMLLECLAPTFTIRFIYDMFDHLLPLLPVELRRQLLAGCRPALLKTLNTLQQEVNALALKRARQIRITLQCFASSSSISSTQLVQILKALRYEQDRCTAMVSLWSRIIDRQNIYHAYQTLSGEEQRQVMHRLGHWYTWTTLERPHGLHFFLDLREAEQRDIAKDIIKLACKTSMGAKAQAKQQGSTQAAQQLMGLRGNGSPMSIPEDDKMWMMIESSYHSLEFDYAPTPEQVERKRLWGVMAIQRHWLAICNIRHKRQQRALEQQRGEDEGMVAELPGAGLGDRSLGQISGNASGRASAQAGRGASSSSGRW